MGEEDGKEGGGRSWEKRMIIAEVTTQILNTETVHGGQHTFLTTSNKSVFDSNDYTSFCFYAKITLN